MLSRLKELLFGLSSPVTTYRAPVDSPDTEPPHGMPQVMKWWMWDGRRVRRHNSITKALKDKAARGRILTATLIYIPALLVFMLLAFVAVLMPIIAVGFLAWLVFGEVGGSLIGVAGFVVALVALLRSMSFVQDRFSPFLKARGISYDEEIFAMVLFALPAGVLMLVFRMFA